VLHSFTAENEGFGLCCTGSQPLAAHCGSLMVGGVGVVFSVVGCQPVWWPGCGSGYFQCDGFGELVGNGCGDCLRGVEVRGFPGLKSGTWETRHPAKNGKNGVPA